MYAVARKLAIKCKIGLRKPITAEYFLSHGLINSDWYVSSVQ